MIIASLTEASQNKRVYLDLSKAYRIEASDGGGTTLWFNAGPVGVLEDVSAILAVLRRSYPVSGVG
jgi:hypothetical protein